ncbi:MAG: Rpn family recombination-promoting nuclease/putative transposase [Spirochaetales bacterium]|jgi:predicted transposase/invertase (TIGR01784 family)|nr:Rpn family recombination-promoting nuclease/putative transposase [Spirochaetales bacterium]
MTGIYLNESDDLIDICLDNVFKAVFTKNTPESQGALAKLLSAVIGRNLSVILITGNEPPVDNLRDRQIRFDINCKAMDASGELLNIEMSLNPDKFEPLRLEFHAGKLFTSQDIRGSGKSYSDLKEAYQIAFLVKGRFFQDGDFLHRFEYYDQLRDVSLEGRSRIITIELAKVEKAAEKPVVEMESSERWAFYFRYITDRSKRWKINEILEYEEGIAMASQVLASISRDEVERARLMSEYKYVVDTQSKVVDARREGRQEGRQEGKLEVAKTLKTLGDPLEKIARVTGLSPDEIAGL